jgi:hypothetical protein
LQAGRKDAEICKFLHVSYIEKILLDWENSMGTIDHAFLSLKGLSHEIDLKKFYQKFTELGLTKRRGWVLNFLRASMIL